MVTSKDYGFIRPRTPFARAWACVSGLELVLSDGRAFSAARLSDRLLEGLERVMSRGEKGLTFELKRSTRDELLGFSVDWRGGSPPSRDFVSAATAELEGMGLTVAHDPAWPFLDVFGAPPDKGRAVEELRRLLDVTGNVLFVVDSAADNPAFERAEVPICVEHGQGLENLACRFVMRYDELDGLLRSLAEDGPSLDVDALRRR
jgi:hypothetical protein